MASLNSGISSDTMGDNGAAAGGADAADDIDVGDGGRVMSSHAAKMSPGVFFCALVYAIVVLKRKAKKIIRRRREKRSRVKSKLKDTIAQSNRQVAEASFGRQIIRPSSAQLLQRRSDQESPAVFNGSTGLWPNRPDTASRATAAAAGVASTTYGAPSITSPSRATIIDHKALSQTKSRAKQIVDRIKLMSPSDALGISGGRAKVSAANYDFFRMVLEKNSRMHKSRGHDHGKPRSRAQSGDGDIADSAGHSQVTGGLATGNKTMKLRREMKQMKKRDLQEVLQYDAGTAVYFGSTVALQSRHGGFLSFAGSDIKASAYKVLPSTRFTMWSADALDETGVVRYGDAIWLQAGQHEVLGAIYVPSQNNNSDSSHGQHRHNGGTGAGSHGTGGAGGGGSGGHGSHHGQGHANAQVDRRNINSYEITPTIINCRGTANFAKAKQYGRWIILHRNNPAEMMGQLVQHFDHVLLEQEWSYLASHSPYDAFMDNRRSSMAHTGVDVATSNESAKQTNDDDDDDSYHRPNTTSVNPSAATNGASGPSKIKRRPPKVLPKNMFACSPDATWKLHIVALPSDDNADNRFRQLIMAEATDQVRQSADAREIKAQFFATPMEKRIDPTLLEDHLLSTSLRHKASDEANQERLLRTLEKQQMRDFKDPLRDSATQKRPQSASDGFDAGETMDYARAHSPQMRRRGAAVSGGRLGAGTYETATQNRLRAIEESYWTQAEDVLADSRSWNVVSGRMDKFFKREARRKDLAARIIQRFFRVNVKVDSWRQKFIELDFNRVRELQHYTGQTFKDFDDFKAHCKKKMVVDFDFMTKIIGFFGPSYKGQILRRRMSTMDAPPDQYRKLIRGESLGIGAGEQSPDERSSSQLQKLMSSFQFSTEGISNTDAGFDSATRASRLRSMTSISSFSEDPMGSNGINHMLNEAAEKRRLEQEKTKRIELIKNKLSVETKETFGVDVHEMINAGKEQPQEPQPITKATSFAINKELSWSGAHSSFEAPQRRPLSASISNNIVTSKPSFDQPGGFFANANHYNKPPNSRSNIYGYDLPSATDGVTDFSSNKVPRPSTAGARATGRKSSKSGILANNDPRMSESLSGLPADVFEGIQHDISLSTSLRFLRATFDERGPSLHPAAKSGRSVSSTGHGHKSNNNIFEDVKVRKKKH